MKLWKLACAVLLLAFTGTFAVAQDKPAPKDDKPKAEKFDRGDAKAEKELKKAYKRVASAEAKGLERMKAEAKIEVDLSSTGLPIQLPPVEGTMLWKSGKQPIIHTEDEGNAGGPMGNPSAIAKQSFMPFQQFVLGFESFESKFKDAHFAFGPKADPKDKEAFKGSLVIVKYKDESLSPETFGIEGNKVVFMTTEREMNGQMSAVEYRFTYEDKGTDLRLSEVTLTTKLTIPEGMEGMPGEQPDPKRPKSEDQPKEEPKKEGDGKGEEKPSNSGDINMSVKLAQFTTIGKAEVCTEMQVTINIKVMGQELSIPASLNLTNAKGNKDVSDADLKPLTEAEGSAEPAKPETPGKEPPKKDPKEKEDEF